MNGLLQCADTVTKKYGNPRVCASVCKCLSACVCLDVCDCVCVSAYVRACVCNPSFWYNMRFLDVSCCVLFVENESKQKATFVHFAWIVYVTDYRVKYW